MRILVIGLGYVGLPVALRLAAQGHQVSGLSRTNNDAAKLAESGVTALTADVCKPASLHRIKPDFDIAVNLVSSSKGGVEEYRQVYLEGTKNIRAWLQGSPLQKYIHTSSTSVYGQTKGEKVTEESIRRPESATSRILVETEDELMTGNASFPTLTARLAGIYGPGRGHLFHQFLAGTARLDGDGGRYLNMIHQEDAIRSFIAAIEHGRPGDRVNVVDNEPVTQRTFFEWLSQSLGRPMPAQGPKSVEPARKRGNTNKQISNLQLRDLWKPSLAFPTFREGYGSEIARLTALGELGAGM